MNLTTRKGFNTLAIAMQEDMLNLTKFPNTLKAIGGILTGKIEETTSMFSEVFVDCKRGLTDLSPDESKNLEEELYLIYQYAIQGKAKENRKLLIKYIKEQVENESIYIDEFYEHRELLANLTPNELKMLSILPNHLAKYDSPELATEQDKRRINYDSIVESNIFRDAENVYITLTTNV